MLTDAVPLYPLYALAFADAGLGEGRISALFALWSVVAVAAEVPGGLLADRFSRRLALVLSGLLTAAGFAVWTLRPTFAGFAAGFVLWGVGGSLASGAFTALLYDGLRAAGEEARFARVLGRAEAGALLVQVPLAAVAGALVALGGFMLVGAASVAVCVAAAGLAATLPDVRPSADGDGGAPGGGGLRAGLREVGLRAPVRAAVAAAGLVAGLDAVEEYSPLLAGGWGVPDGLVPTATVAIPLLGAAGALAGGRLVAAPGMAIGGLVAAGGGLLLLAAGAGHPLGLVAVALVYGAVRLAAVVAEAWMQDAITGPGRATIGSVAGVAAELAALPVFLVWGLGGLPAVAVTVIVAGLAAGSLMDRAIRR